MAKLASSGLPDQTPAGPHYFQNPSDETPPLSGFDSSGRQLEQMGATLSNAGGDLGKVAENEQNKANDLAVIEAENSAREAAINLTTDPNDGFASVKGADAVHRDSGLPLAVEYHNKLNDRIASIQSGLTNDVQKQAFARSASAISTDFYSRASSYEADQYQDYHKSVMKGSVELASQNIGLHYTDPDAVSRDLSSLDVATAKLGQLNGMAGDEIDAMRNTARSNALTQSVKLALANGDTAGATSFFNAHKADILANDQAEIAEPLRRSGLLQARQTYGEDYVNGLLNGVPVGAQQPGQAGKPNAAQVWQQFISPHEGGYSASDGNGKPVNHGINQGANPGVNVASLSDGEAEKIFEQKYWNPSGAANLPAGLAAMHADTYFINPKEASKFLAEAGGDPAKYMQLRSAWMNNLVQTDPGKYGRFAKAWGNRNRDLSAYAANLSGGGTNSATGRSNMTLEDAVAAASTKLYADHPDATPEMRQSVEEGAESTWRIHNQSQSTQIDQTVSGAFRTLQQNGGDLSKLPPSVVQQIPAEKWDSVISFAKQLQAPAPRNKAQDDALYNEAITNHDWLKGLSDADFLKDFQGHPQFNELAKQRGILQGKIPVGGKETTETLNYSTINRIVETRLQSLGIDTSPKTGPVGQIGAVRRVINGAIAGEQRRVGHQLSDVETESFIDRQMSRPGIIQSNTVLGIPTGSKTSLPLFAVGAKDIPSDQAALIDQALDKAGMPKTDQNRLLLYYRGKMR